MSAHGTRSTRKNKILGERSKITTQTDYWRLLISYPPQKSILTKKYFRCFKHINSFDPHNDPTR